MVVSSFLLARIPDDILSDAATKAIFMLSVVHVLLIHVTRRKQKPVDGATVSAASGHSPAEFLHVNFSPASYFLEDLSLRAIAGRMVNPLIRAVPSVNAHRLCFYCTTSFLADAWYNCHDCSCSFKGRQRISIRNPVINAEPLFCFKNITQPYAQSHRTEGHI